jgi:hypothetical protein
MRVPAIRSLHQPSVLSQPLPFLPRGWWVLGAAVIAWGVFLIAGYALMGGVL